MQPKTLLNIPRSLWIELTHELGRRTEGSHESGVFLLGSKTEGARHATTLIYYDELDPMAYASGVCILHAGAFVLLWERCRDLQLSVVADVHVHPFGAGQSRSDRENPMVARAGHLALIIPYMARLPIERAAVGLYEYLGDHQWRTHCAIQDAGVLNIEEEK